ncbi:formimidoylglutamase [Pseudomonas sp. DTU_2021_1001937_2_SI_NGA_ILE_001]|uniref:formimidoylglutamase n=1 Tax=Pseudomonas sp. DTU_2021_1001937_2_SI_NGA_ILE_001 TaxID=3077589 RepID=UPI0028FC0EAF|nr:formimidoylglutamase [Pseudomonas sp. DTU_2021_1001937_2_SI_NGA_ILE_001]WNW09862.1 formimidoylglutamase [Pseudomonas sp. DTU_2021_1001937_2_SI_NGA_ILE_001]
MIADRLNMDTWAGRVDPEPDSARWHQCIQPWAEAAAPGVALLGFACDEGVRRNQGRTGAAGGPLAMRKALASLAWHRAAPAWDAGDIHCEDGDLEAAQQRLAAAVSRLLSDGQLPIVLGGGHEVAFGSWSGLARHFEGQGAAPRIGIVNFDAHFDLRDHATVRSSGTPFSQIAEQCRQRGWTFDYACIGVSRASNTRALFQRAAELGVLVREDHEIRESTLQVIGDELHYFALRCDALYLTIDIDVLPASEAPGVSAPAARGVPIHLLEPLVQRLRDSGRLRLVDLAELNPSFDIDNHTAKAAARLIHTLTLTTHY